MNEKLVIDSDRDRELQATRFSQMQNNFCNESKPDTDTDTASEDTIMPPPAPYYVRRPQLLGPQTISRTKSAASSLNPTPRNCSRPREAYPTSISPAHSTTGASAPRLSFVPTHSRNRGSACAPQSLTSCSNTCDE